MNYREKMRKAIECPQFGNETYGEWGALRFEQRVLIKRLLDELDRADNCFKKIYLENKQLKKQVEEYKDNYNCLLKQKEQFEYIMSKQVDYQGQKKEFIKYLEDEISKQKEDIFANSLTAEDIDLYIKRIKLLKMEEILQKYKEIIGGK